LADETIQYPKNNILKTNIVQKRNLNPIPEKLKTKNVAGQLLSFEKPIKIQSLCGPFEIQGILLKNRP
jgi:hypothetical protein